MQYKDDALHVLANVLVTRGKIKRIIEENAEWIRAQKKAACECHQQEERKKNDHSDYDDLTYNASQSFVGQHNSAINRARALEHQQLIKDIFAGRKTMILGDIVDVLPSLSSKTYLDGSTLYIAEKSYIERDLRIKAIKTYLKKIAFLFVASEVSSFGSSVSLCPQKIEFKDIGDCWCKCSLSAQKILCFDYRLTQLPQNFRNYVIAHAFAHFRYPAHDEAFYNHLSNVVPHYKDVANQIEMFDFLKDI